MSKDTVSQGDKPADKPASAKSPTLAKSTEDKSADKPSSAKAPEDKLPSLEDFFMDADFSQLSLTVEEMFRVGAHFGHKKSRRNPRMEEFVYTYRDGVAIIDLKKSLDILEEALEVIRAVARGGKKLLFVGTKKHAKLLTLSAAKRIEQPFVSNRWLGGTFTNFDVIKKRVQYMKDLEQKIKGGELSGYTKFEQMKKMEEAEKLKNKVGGLRDMDELPGAVFMTDVTHDELAVREARATGVPVIAIVDTNDDPSQVDYMIPANNDALSSLKFLLGHVCKAYEAASVAREI